MSVPGRSIAGRVTRAGPGVPRMARLAIAVATAWIVSPPGAPALAVPPGAIASPGSSAGQIAPVTDDAVTAVARQLRCVVCQNLSVAGSPSEMARQMRDLIREQLAAGRTPTEVTAYFVARYGEWVLLAPPMRGFNLVLWGLPFVALVGGLGLIWRAARRWTRHVAVETGPVAAIDSADRQRVRAELDRLVD